MCRWLSRVNLAPARSALDYVVIGREVWERRKGDNDKGIKLILGLERNKEIVGETKKYLRDIWKKKSQKRTKTRRSDCRT